ncbi:MAG: HK97-gp10 family putative phage morphogenesis protein [Terrisporobacter othiniensis]|uniref:HK97-gp10 family putative phage morphogenesis protein n=1 Tax=Terrisporobacter othiniensis TaxID=1577792 RepID=UPI001B413C69|nr:HK97-gp10 family putative phage morphogenesis protein [Terrisporobacter othiniensis]MBP3930649.1 HK97 gp10 family phage protein [Peptostreptococcaceae bacterium]MDY3373318.1 HK97-gp10 family putative phage morphogenesis protein [Terrisporobacter othiniensis]
MSVNLDFSDLDKLQKRLDEMGRKGSTLENKALLAGAEVINKEVVKNAPERTGHAKKYLKVSKVSKEKGIKVVKVGISKGDNSEAFYLKFHEYGTSKMAARPFMRPAFERKRKEALEKTYEVIKEGLGL